MLQMRLNLKHKQLEIYLYNFTTYSNTSMVATKQPLASISVAVTIGEAKRYEDINET